MAKKGLRVIHPGSFLAATKIGLCLASAATLAGCAHFGPKTVVVDRFDYSTAIADSWKQQTLLNIVKLRYMDLPVFVDVASIVAGYSFQTGVSLTGTLSSDLIMGHKYSAGHGALAALSLALWKSAVSKSLRPI